MQVRPRQPKAPIANVYGLSNLCQQPPRHFLIDQCGDELVLSKNGFLLTYLFTDGGHIPLQGVDAAIYVQDRTVVAITVVTEVIEIKAAPSQPGRYRILVACAPMTSLERVPVPEGHESDLQRERAQCKHLIDTFRGPAAPRYYVGALMADQQAAHALVLDTILDMHLLNVA